MMMSVVMEALDPKSAVTTIHSVNQGPTYTNLCGQLSFVCFSLSVAVTGLRREDTSKLMSGWGHTRTM